MLKNFLTVYSQPKILTILLLGFSSGLPRALCAWTLSIWLADAGVDIVSIGLFAAASMPYALKFLWSPLMDGTSLPLLCARLGQRRGWLIATQMALMIALASLGFSRPGEHALLTAALALLVAFFSASQDIVIDAYRVEILSQEEQGAGAASIVLGYRLGMIASGAGALFLATRMGWPMTYVIMAALMLVGMVTVLMNREPGASDKWQVASGKENKTTSLMEWIREHVIAPFLDFMTRPHWLGILLFILLYKLGDAFMGNMTGPFLIQIGFTKDDIATAVKLYGVIATIVGSFIGGSLVVRLGVTRSLWICGLAHAFTNLMFVEQARLGADLHFLVLSISLENISGGMGTAAFVAFMSGLTHRHYTATQYALISSFAAFGVTWLSTPAGWFVQSLGWEGFFMLAAVLAVPGLVTLWYLSPHLLRGPAQANDQTPQ